MVRKLSTDNSKSGGRMLTLCSLIPAPILVTSRKLQPNTPRSAPKNSKAPFIIFALPTDLRSIWRVIHVLSEPLVDPLASIMAPPDLSKKQPPRNRTPGNNNGPQVPNFGPRRRGSARHKLIDLVAAGEHVSLKARNLQVECDPPDDFALNIQTRGTSGNNDYTFVL
jgi:hypothetical protein